MNRCLLAAGAAVLALASPPSSAVGPLVLVAKQIVQGFVKDFIEQRIDQAIRASFGPCKADLAEAAVATRRSLTGGIGGGGVPGLGALGALGGLGSAGAALRAGVPGQGGVLANAGAAAAALQAPTGGMPGTGAATLGAATPLAGMGATASGAGSGAGMLPGMLPGMPGMPGMPGAALLSGMPGMPGAANALGSMAAVGAGGGADMAGAMAMLQQMMSAPPLTDAEFDDFVRRLERFGKVAESIEPGIGCSADDYRRMLGTVRTAGGPMSGMGGGMLRMMHTTLLDAEQRLAETATMFEQMTPEDRAETVESLAADLRSGPPEGRRATLAMVDAGMLKMPPDMAAALRARLQP